MTAQSGGPGARPSPEHLSFLLPSGDRVHWLAAPGQDSAQRGPFRLRSVVLGEGLRSEQRRLPAAYVGDAQLYQELEDEIRALHTLHRRYGRDGYPRSLPRLIGYDADAEEPFVLYTAAEGKPVAQATALAAKQRRYFAQGLLTALRQLEGAGLVHRDISPENVLWDGTQVSLAGLATAVPVGRRRRPVGAAPWASPEQLAGTGRTDPRDDVWSAAQVIYHVLAERPVNAAGAPHGLSGEAALSSQLSGAFAVAAADRPGPAAMLVRFTGRDPLKEASDPPDPFRLGREQFDQVRGRRPEPAVQRPPGRRPLGRFLAGRAQGPSAPAPQQGQQHEQKILCPFCLDTLVLDEQALYFRDNTMTYQPKDLSCEPNPLRRDDIVKSLWQACTNTGNEPAHFLPVEYLMHGRPLTIAMVGASGAGKTHLLASMMSEIEASALGAYGVEVRPANADWHNAFLRKQVGPLRSGRTLGATPEAEFAKFEDALLLTANGATRPMAFFDVSGEDLMRTDTGTRFLAAVDAVIFVVDPIRALRLPAAQAAREQMGLAGADAGDPTFGTVLNRLRRREGRVVAAAALALTKSDLLRFEAPVDRWLAADPGERPGPNRWERESRDVFAFLSAHADRAWLRPMAECDHATAHFVSATGAAGTRQRSGARPQRVLEPLLSVLDACGMLGQPAEQMTGGDR